MQEVIILKGIPASGKSTWAKEQLKTNPEKYKRINKDDLRAMLDLSKWTENNEKFVLQVRNLLTLQSLKEGYSVIVDDTNLHPKHEHKIKNITQDYCNSSANSVLFQIKWFHIDPKEALERDKNRTAAVGKHVIDDMFKKYSKIQDKIDSKLIIYPQVTTIEQDPDLPKIVICDIDGTIAEMSNRGLLNGRR